MRDNGKEDQENARSRRIGEFVQAWQASWVVNGLEGGRLSGVRVRMRTVQEPSTLLVVRACVEDAKFIAFIGAYSVADALLAWRARAQADRMKWREDRPWHERKGSSST